MDRRWYLAGLACAAHLACGDARTDGGPCAAQPLSAPELAARGDVLFDAPRPVTGVAAPIRARMIDVDGDGAREILVATSVGVARLAYRESRGGYAPSGLVEATGGTVTDFDAGDLDGDGHIDVAALKIASFSPVVSVTWGSGAPPVSAPLPGARLRVVPGGPGGRARVMVHRPELIAFASFTAGTLAVDGLLDTVPPTADPRAIDEPLVGDWNGDGQADLAVVQREPMRALIELLPGDASAPAGFGPSTLVAIADLIGLASLRIATGDALLIAHRIDGRVVLETWGGQVLAAQAVSTLDVDNVRVVAAADLDADGLDELVLSAISTYVLTRAPDGGLQLRAALPGEARLLGPEAHGDVDGDGREDLLIQRVDGLELVRTVGALPAPLCTLPSNASPSVAVDRPTVVTVEPGQSVQAAVDAVPARGTVLLAPGEHQGPVLVQRALAIRGRDGAAVTRLIAPGSSAAIDVTQGAVRIEGLTIEGNPESVGVVVPDGSAVVDCVLIGHGLSAVVHNFSLEARTPIHIDRCVLRRNGHATGSAAVSAQQGRLVLTNNLLWDNIKAISADVNELVAINNTITANDRPSDLSAETLTLLNNIIHNNGFRPDTLRASSRARVDYNLMMPPADVEVGPHNVDADPRFTDPAMGDFTLLPGSPAIGTGTTAGAPGLDLRGRPRPPQGPIDMGALQR